MGLVSLLEIHWNIDPVLIHIGSYGLRWYSLLFVGGFILGWYIIRTFLRREKVNEKVLDPMLYTMLIATIIGARLGHCLFYQPDYYLGSWQGFLEIFQPWKGGLASHGAAIAILLALIWYAKHYGTKNGFDYLWVTDRLVIVICFAGAMIRLGNLFNSEIYGGVTDLPWGFVFERNGETLPKHPTQLYESLAYALIGFFLLFLYNRKLFSLKRGELTGLFFAMVFLFRFFVEFIKNPQVDFENDMLLNMGQLLSIPFTLGGIALFIWSFKKGKPEPSDNLLKEAAKKSKNSAS